MSFIHVNIINEFSILLDVKSIAFVHLSPADYTLKVMSVDGAKIISFPCPNGIGDAQAFLAQCVAGGADLLPVYSGHYPALYVSPAAIVHAKISAQGDVVFGVQGFENFATKDGPEWQALFAAFQQTGNTILSYTPDIAYSGFYEPGELHVVPAYITSMVGDGCPEELRVEFAHNGTLDMQVDGGPEERERMTSRLMVQFMHEGHDNYKDLAVDEMDRLLDKRRRQLAAALAAHTGGALTEIKYSKRPVYVRLDDIDHVRLAGDTQLNVRTRKLPGQTYSISIGARFNCAAERDASARALMSLLPAKRQASQPPSP